MADEFGFDFAFIDESTQDTSKPKTPMDVTGEGEEIDGYKLQIAVKASKTMSKGVRRFLTGERILEEIMPWQAEKGTAYHILTFGNVSSVCFLKWILRQQNVPYIVLSSLAMSERAAEEIDRYLAVGAIGKVDFFFGDLAKCCYPGTLPIVRKLCDRTGSRCFIVNNHSKVIAGIGDRFGFAIESSANATLNYRLEQATITIDDELAQFYIDAFEEVSQQAMPLR